MIKAVSKLDDCVGMPVREFVLHREPMLLLDTVVLCTESSTECEWLVSSEDSFFVAGKGVPVYIGIEYMAQCVAAHAGVRERAAGFGPPLGFLLGTRHFTAEVSHLREGERYRATCEELIRDSNGMGSYECSIQHAGRTVAAARLAVLEKERGGRLA